MDGSPTLLPIRSCPGVGGCESGGPGGQGSVTARPLAGYWLSMIDLSLGHARS